MTQIFITGLGLGVILTYTIHLVISMYNKIKKGEEI